MDAEVRFSLPDGWTGTDVLPPALGSEVTLDHWQAWEAPAHGSGRAVSGCVGLDVSTWADEVTPIAEERLLAVVGTVATRLDPRFTLHVVRTDRTPVTTEQLLARGGTEAPAVAETVLGFTGSRDHPHLAGCFVLCAPSTPECEHAVAETRPSNFIPPPPANLVLRAAVFGVHHPRGVATSGALALFVLGVVAVWTRPRPRRK